MINISCVVNLEFFNVIVDIILLLLTIGIDTHFANAFFKGSNALKGPLV